MVGSFKKCFKKIKWLFDTGLLERCSVLITLTVKKQTKYT